MVQTGDYDFTYIDKEVAPFCHIIIGNGWFPMASIRVEHLPEVLGFLALLNNCDVLGRSFVLLQESNVVPGGLRVSLHVDVGNLPADPQVDLGRCHHDEEASGVQSLCSISLKHVLHHKLGHHAAGVFCLVRAHEETSRIHGQSVEVCVIKSFLEPDKLGDKGHVWVDALPASFESHEPVVVRNTFCLDHVREAKCRRAGDALHTVYVQFTALGASFLHKFDCVVEHAGDVFSHVILQVIALVDHTLVDEIVFTVICATVDNMSDAVLLEVLFVFRHQITAEEEEPVNHLRAHSLVERVLVFFSRRSLKVEVFVIQLLRRDLQLVEPLRSGATVGVVHSDESCQACEWHVLPHRVTIAVSLSLAALSAFIGTFIVTATLNSVTILVVVIHLIHNLLLLSGVKLGLLGSLLSMCILHLSLGKMLLLDCLCLRQIETKAHFRFAGTLTREHWVRSRAHISQLELGNSFAWLHGRRLSKLEIGHLFLLLLLLHLLVLNRICGSNLICSEAELHGRGQTIASCLLLLCLLNSSLNLTQVQLVHLESTSLSTAAKL